MEATSSSQPSTARLARGQELVIREVDVVEAINQWKGSERGSSLSQNPTLVPVIVGEVSNFFPGPTPSCTRKRYGFALVKDCACCLAEGLSEVSLKKNALAI